MTVGRTGTVALLLSALLLFRSAGAAPPDTPSDAPFGGVLEDAFAEMDVPGLGYAVVEDGRIVEAGGLGIADIDQGTPVGARTPFRIASLTKPLSAALLLNAVHEGKADLDMPLRAASSKFDKACRPMKAYFKLNRLPYLDGIGCGDDGVLIRHVLTHTAKSPPGSTYAYNGFLFGLLSDEIGDVTVGGGDDNFVRAVRREVIAPLELGDTAAGITDEENEGVVTRLAVPHGRENGTWVVGPIVEDPLNAGAGLIASAEDLARIDIAYRDRLLADPSIWDRMTTPTLLTDETRSPYGMGWFVQEADEREVVWHYGHQPGAYSALWIKDVENRRSLIVLANSAGLAEGHDLHLGDLTRSPLARRFLLWSARRAETASDRL